MGVAGIALPCHHDAGHGLGVGLRDAVVTQHIHCQRMQLVQGEGDGVGGGAGNARVHSGYQWRFAIRSDPGG